MRGFTLVEVMVAVAVTALLVLGVSAAVRGAVDSAKVREAGARLDERRGRAVELLRADWKSRLLIRPAPYGPGESSFALVSTADSLAGERSSEVVYAASEKGLARREGKEGILLVPEPVQLEFWDGVSWAKEPRKGIVALRLILNRPAETIVIR